MIDFDNSVCKLADSIEYALEEIGAAIEVSDQLHQSTLRDAEGRHSGDGWSEMLALHQRLSKIREELANAMPESIRRTCEASAEAVAIASEVADATSY